MQPLLVFFSSCTNKAGKGELTTPTKSKIKELQKTLIITQIQLMYNIFFLYNTNIKRIRRRNNYYSIQSIYKSLNENYF